MESITCFKAYDGTLFTDKEQCIEYEKKKPRNYLITLYATGTFCTQVCAKSEEEAIQVAKDQCYPEEMCWDFDDEKAEIQEETNV